MTETNNLRLKKFESTDNFDYEVLNENWDAVSDVASNPNLLDNSDFCNPINQRRVTASTWGSGYGIDRWSKSGSYTITSMDSTGITFNYALYQYLEPSVLELDTIYTFSAKISGNIYVASGMFKSSQEANKIYDDGNVSIYLRTDSGVNRPYVSFGSADQSKTVRFEWAKLEKGDRPTKWQKPDYATELLKCQRYLYRLDNTLTMSAGVGIAMNAITLRWIIHGVNMRSNPTLIGNLLRDGNVNLTFNSSGMSEGYVLIDFTTSGLTANTMHIISRNSATSAFLTAEL